jgi:hypothetical protein
MGTKQEAVAADAAACEDAAPADGATQDTAAQDELATIESGDPEGDRAEDAVPGIGTAQPSGEEPEWHPPDSGVTPDGDTYFEPDPLGAGRGGDGTAKACVSAGPLKRGDPAAAPTMVGADEIADF